ncbi:hypothetical protein F5Y15DRAFT_166690 [Xylariaceae sp. FL0016]|nr:hypothetical protein F5Y15DRAFT_166690 [Xylariaceae sp. FL0016]
MLLQLPQIMLLINGYCLLPILQALHTRSRTRLTLTAVILANASCLPKPQNPNVIKLILLPLPNDRSFKSATIKACPIKKCSNSCSYKYSHSIIHHQHLPVQFPAGDRNGNFLSHQKKIKIKIKNPSLEHRQARA